MINGLLCLVAKAGFGDTAAFEEQQSTDLFFVGKGRAEIMNGAPLGQKGVVFIFIFANGCGNG